MNYHELLDEATVRLGSALLGSKKFFAQSLDAPPIDEAVREAAPTSTATTQASTDLTFEQTDTPQTISIQTPTGTYEAGYLVWQWKRPSLPTILFHHGSGEDPFDVGRFAMHSVTRLFADPEDIPANIIAVRAPFHDEGSDTYAKAMGDLGDFVGMLAASTAVTETLREALIEQGGPAVVVSGISLGGWVTNLHHAVHDSAQLYAPLFAGDRLGEMFVSSAYHRMTGELAHDQPDTIRDLLDFEEVYADATAPTRPLLGRYDRIIELEVQQPAYADADLAVIDYGHVTGALQASTLREHVVEAMVEAPGADET